MITAQWLQHAIIDEILSYLNLPDSGWRAALAALALRLPAERFTRLGIKFELQVSQTGFCDASRWLLSEVLQAYRVSGSEQIPPTGPLILAANHPGSFDTFLIAACLPRQDVKVIARDMPLLRQMESTRQYLIFSSRDPYQKLTVIREAIEHLQRGGVLVVYPTGKMDPDPGCMQGADQAIETWSHSLELLMRKVPETRFQVVVISGLMDHRMLHHPLVRWCKDSYQRQVMAEILLVGQQFAHNTPRKQIPEITFGNTYTTNMLLFNGSGNLMRGAIEAAQKLLFFHQCSMLPGLRYRLPKNTQLEISRHPAVMLESRD